MCNVCKIPNLFTLMKEKNITQKVLSEAVGVSQGNISDWKSGRSSPTIDALIKSAQYFNVSVDYLLGNNEQSIEDIVKTYLFGTTDIDDKILNQVKQYATFLTSVQEKYSVDEAARIESKIHLDNVPIMDEE